jgi:hypothetical protein
MERGLPRRVTRRLKDERGIALVMALGVLLVLSITLASIISYTSTNSRSSARERAGQQSLALAEAGVNNGLEVIYNAEDPSDGSLLPDGSPERPALVKSYEGGKVTWTGKITKVGDDAAGTWKWEIRSTGTVVNPTGPGAADVQRTLTANVFIRFQHEQNLDQPIWNWIYSAKTGGVCDMVIDQSIALASPLWVVGNLCLRNTAKILSGPLVVEGSATLDEPQNAIGSQSVPINQVYVGNGCRYKINPSYNPCAYNDPNNQTTTNIWRTAPYPYDPANPMRPNVPLWDHWHLHASPGPFSPCSEVSGTPPVFDLPDADGVRRRNNTMVPGVFHLTPATSYTCKTRRGELSWDPSTRVLKVRGTIFIDGSAKIENGLVNSYDAFSVIHLSGTLLIKNSAMCAVTTSTKSACNANAWDPSTNMLVFAVDGQGGQLAAGTSIDVVSGHFQGALYGTYAVKASTTSTTQGPAIAQEIVIGQSNNVSFPTLTIVPIAMPGEPVPPPILEDPEVG